MPVFQVLRRVDAFVDYVASVEADSPDEAAAKADADETLFDWEEVNISEFDARMFVALDDSGDEIDGTQRGDF